jgi:uncharacterized protein (TIGR00251 family)
LPFCTDTPGGVLLAVRVIPRARKTEAAGIRAVEDGDALVVRLAAPPVDGAANEALVAFLARQLGVPLRAVRIVSGERGRHKRVMVEGVTADHVRSALQ